MVWLAAPAAGTARAFSAVSSINTLELLPISHSQRASASPKKRKTPKRVELSHGFSIRRCVLPHHTSTTSFCRCKRRRANLRLRVYAALENKETSNFGQSLLDFARKTVDTVTTSSEALRGQPLNKAIDRKSRSNTDQQEGRQTEQDTERAKTSGSHPKPTRLLLDLHNRRISLPDWKRNFRETLENASQNLEATRLGPLPPFSGSLVALLGFVLIIGVVLDKWIGRATSGAQVSNTSIPNLELSKAPTGIPIFLEKDLKKKESVEWVNMVLGKLWKIYRLGLEGWLLGLLQPLIDNLQKPGYVKRVEISQFSLGDEPIGIRSVERRASRRVNDLQYHIGLRYSGTARMLLLLRLRVGFIPITIPVGVRGLDVDGELWVKMRLVPSEPWVGAATWAFVSLPKIKLVLSPFHVFNLMAIPFLSTFLTKLLTQDLPQLFVRPNKNVVDFMKGEAAGPLPKDFKVATMDGNKGFSGELSVTLVDARRLPYIPYTKTDPYVLFVLGDQAIRSKKNSQTSVIGPPGRPIWNQDFQLLVVDHETQRLGVRVRDYIGLTSFTVGYGEVELSALRDTVPDDRVVTLRGIWGPLWKRFAGEISLRLTYTAYVDDDDQYEKADVPLHPPVGYASDLDDTSPWSTINKIVHQATENVPGKESMTEMISAVTAEFRDEAREELMVAEKIARKTSNIEDLKEITSGRSKVGNDGKNIGDLKELPSGRSKVGNDDKNSTLVQLDVSEKQNGSE